MRTEHLYGLPTEIPISHACLSEAMTQLYPTQLSSEKRSQLTHTEHLPGTTLYDLHQQDYYGLKITL